MAEIDFITALGRLLRDGKLRDAFAADPQAVAAEIGLRRSDWPSLPQLIPADLEFQAHILLRKRLELVRSLIPRTARQLGEQFWPRFLTYARAHWPDEPRAALHDAFQFCEILKQAGEHALSPSEWNRLRFALSAKHVAVHWVLKETIHGKKRPLLQLFFRGRSQKWRELICYFGL